MIVSRHESSRQSISSACLSTRDRGAHALHPVTYICLSISLFLSKTCHMLPRCAISQTPSASALCHPSRRAGTPISLFGGVVTLFYTCVSMGKTSWPEGSIILGSRFLLFQRNHKESQGIAGQPAIKSLPIVPNGAYSD